MAEPPPSGSHSDITGANRDARTGAPTRDQGSGGSGDKANADEQSKGQPDQGDSGK